MSLARRLKRTRKSVEAGRGAKPISTTRIRPVAYRGLNGLFQLEPPLTTVRIETGERGGTRLVMTAVGVDVQSIDEVEAALTEYGTRYTRRLFTDHEVKQCSESPRAAAGRYAERFAAKEAVLKVLNVREVVPSWKDIEIQQSSSGRFGVVLHGAAADLAHQQGIGTISLSISRARGTAAAVVVAS